ncbi:alpha/beta fold hydrolase [Hyalangium rubrum]|uniref:Alpha/beta hydrolase n=1 Tax=Hyalangium rubrum TaxID=3103134 RepID=A0ABU5H142_9BACT|nr:alpha/beta hydrolase [Hyalangium sp. s54d21]MDY7227026.1 alpha/beta hydrolase [Hyalangium sp. s54d21]
MKLVAFLLGVVAVPLSALLLVAAVAIGASASAWGYALGLAVASAGLITMPWRRRRGLTRAGLGLMLLVACARLLLVKGQYLDTLRLPEGGRRLANRLLEERDGTLFVARLLLLSGQLPRSDTRDFLPALNSAFARMAAEEGPIATPAIATWLGLQSSSDFDAVVIPPQDRERPEVAVVALHGYAGNFAVYCWQLSRSARAISALTVCPSVGPAGDWWSPQGEETLKHTLAWLEGRGIRRVYLAGLSNGGLGASLLASRVSRPGVELRGLVLISGASKRAPTPRVPTLIVQGKHDSMMPTPPIRAFAQRTGPLATYFEVNSGHFAFLDRHEACERAITQWLLQREAPAAARR